MRRRSRKPEWQLKIARERIRILFDLASKFFPDYPERARRYIKLARKIGLRYNIRLSRKQKRKFCKKCNSLLIPGISCTIRLDAKNKTLNIKCKNCNNIIRVPYK